MKSLLQTYNDIFLRTNSDTQRLELRDIEGSGTDYYCTLVVESNRFAANSRFHFDEEHLFIFLKNLNEMETKLEGEAVLKNYFDNNHIKLEVSKTGQIFVSGILAKYGEYPQTLEFCFQTDQTVLKPLIDDFNKYLKFG